MNYFEDFTDMYITLYIYICLYEGFRRIHIWISRNKVLKFNHGMNRVYPNLLKGLKQKKKRGGEQRLVATAVVLVSC